MAQSWVSHAGTWLAYIRSRACFIYLYVHCKWLRKLLSIVVSIGNVVIVRSITEEGLFFLSFLSDLLFQVIVVPLLDGMLGATVPAYTWVGAFMSVVGVGMLESSGSPPSVGARRSLSAT